MVRSAPGSRPVELLGPAAGRTASPVIVTDGRDLDKEVDPAAGGTATPTQIGNYDLILKIAEGGMGAVYKARHKVSGDIVAIKIVPPETAKNPVLVRRFEQEFKAASLLAHPNVVKAIEFGTVPSPYLVMEYVDGESLGQMVERISGPIQEKLAVHYITQVCDGLHRAHKQGLIHRDVKPDH